MTNKEAETRATIFQRTQGEKRKTKRKKEKKKHEKKEKGYVKFFQKQSTNKRNMKRQMNKKEAFHRRVYASDGPQSDRIFKKRKSSFVQRELDGPKANETEMKNENSKQIDNMEGKMNENKRKDDRIVWIPGERAKPIQ